MDYYIMLAYVLGYIGIFASCFYLLSYLLEKKKTDVEEAEDKTVSIVIPAYNEQGSIKRTIESALAIDYPEDMLEIIVVNDGSKDKTYEIAKKFLEKKNKFRIRVYTKKNGGKGSALNKGISKAKHEIIFSMDADTFVKPNAVKRMIARFYNKEVMAVTPSMGVHNPKGILPRIQQIEYYLGVFLRKAFGSMNAIHITPGAFSAYRKEFFDKYGGYDEGNITEDLEIALRIQSKDFILENAPTAVIYTIAPRKFRELFVQRRRWYTGLITNLWAYRKLFGPKKGPMGTVVLPTAVITVFLSVIMTVYMVIRSLLEIKRELFMLDSINFQFDGVFEFSNYYIQAFFERMFYRIVTQPVFLLLFLFVGLLIFYMIFSRKHMGYKEGIKMSLLLFLALYSFLFAFWWIISFLYVIFNKKVIWREETK